MEATGRLLTIRECAERLGMTEGQLRELARKGKLPASKQAGRWLVQSAELDTFRPVRRLAPATKKRARLAEGVAVDDMIHQLLHKGLSVTPPASKQQQAPATVKERARAAQGKALEHLEQRLDKPHPPERSL
ncbi:MAG TPA: helix-turn-helix domain-containing protein [Chloroflexota bacterium]|nr:helix-turn-helix domain-containing protein [Chloroflexota bacterium]